MRCRLGTDVLGYRSGRCSCANADATVSGCDDEGRLWHLERVTWTLFAGEFVSAKSFSHCFNVVVGPNPAHRGGGGACGGGGLRRAGELLPTSPPAPGFSYGMTYGGSSDCPTFFVFEGLIVANARQVAITLSTGKTVTTPTIPSPRGLAQSLRFWATHIPCGTNPTGMVGRDATGRVVARMDSRLLPHTPTG